MKNIKENEIVMLYLIKLRLEHKSCMTLTTLLLL